jgi:hypothetical protein
MRKTLSRGSVLAVLLLMACDSGPTAPTIDSVAGAYHATQFLTTASGATTNQLTAGATLTLDLMASGQVSGQLYAPDGEGGWLDASMAGTWTLADGVVHFAQSADTFVRDMPFSVGSGVLSGDRTFSSTRVQVTLTRTP